MANLFGILTAIVLALSAFLAVRNKAQYAQELTQRTDEQHKLEVTQEQNDAAHKNLDETVAKRTETETEIGTLATQKITLEGANEKLKTDMAAKTAKIEEIKKQLDDIKGKLDTATNGGGSDIETMVNAIKSARAQIEELNQKIASSEADLANITAESGRLEKVAEGFRAASALYPAKKSNPSLKTRISAVYPNWGFVTIGAGNSSGVVTNSTLEVVRGGETIAKLLVTAAEGSTASASIVPDSLKADTTLMVGDSVVPAN